MKADLARGRFLIGSSSTPLLHSRGYVPGQRSCQHTNSLRPLHNDEPNPHTLKACVFFIVKLPIDLDLDLATFMIEPDAPVEPPHYPQNPCVF